MPLVVVRAPQSQLRLHYLPTPAHSPPVSPYHFVSKSREPADLRARTMFCDVTVSLPKRDIDGKVGMHSTDGCHLGYTTPVATATLFSVSHSSASPPAK